MVQPDLRLENMEFSSEKMTGNRPGVTGENRKLELMMLASCYGVGGFETKLDSLVRSINRDIFNLTVLHVYPYYKGRTVPEDVRNIHRAYFFWDDTETIELVMNWRYDLTMIKKVARILEQRKPDILYFLAMGSMTFIAPVAGRMAKVPCIIRAADTIFDGLYPGILKGLDRRLLSMTDMIIAPSFFLKKMIRNELRADEDSIRVIPNAIDLSKFGITHDADAAVLRKELGIPEKSHVVGVVANLTEIKTLDVLIRSAPAIIDRFPDTIFLMIGEGPSREELESLAASLGIMANMRFVGYREDVEKLISIFTVGALSSQIEIHPISLIEIMSAGIPVVAPEVGGIPEIVSHGETGLLFPAGDSVRLAEAVNLLLGDRSKRRKYGKEARKRVQEQFAKERMIRATEEAFLDGYRMKTGRSEHS